MNAAVDISLLPPELLMLTAEKLPASERAAFEWEAGKLRASIQRLVRELDEPGRLDEVAVELVVRSSKLLPRVVELVGVAPALAAVGSSVDDTVAGIRALDPAAADALRWAATQLSGFSDLAEKVTDDEWLARMSSLDEQTVGQAVRSQAGPVLRVFPLVLAASEALRDEATRSVAPELAWRAFEEATVVVDLLAEMVEVEPSDPKAFLRAARWLADELEESDLRVLDEAGMRDLR